MILPFLAVGIRQTSQATETHPHRQIVSLNMARANQVFIRAAATDGLFRAYYGCWRVATMIVWRIAEYLDQLGKVHVELKRQRDRRLIRAPAVSANLKPASRGISEFSYKFPSAVTRPLVEMPSDNKFRIPFNRAAGVSFYL